MSKNIFIFLSFFYKYISLVNESYFFLFSPLIKGEIMPRKARQKSCLSIYHVILRGINQQIIFEDNYDYLQFISVLKFYKNICNFKLYAYCLMDNHIHLLIEHSDIELDIIMKKIEVKFVRWYNKKYQRIGNLFQDRYKSEPVNDMRYFQTVFRYVHQNPINAGLETSLGTYPWSSYHDYEFRDNSFIDIEKILNLFSNHLECMNYLNTSSGERCLEYFSSSRLPDEVALKIIQAKTACKSPSDFQHLDFQTRNKFLKSLSQAGISIRQLSRLTGISKTAISSAIR